MHINEIFGLDAERLNALQMIARAITTFFVALLLIRISGLRTLGKQTSFDQLTILMLGAIMGRGVVTPSQPFFGAMLAVLVIMLLHRLLAWITFKSKSAGWIFKGEPLLLIKNGRKNMHNLKMCNISEDDLLEALRRDLHLDSLDEIKEAYLERSGEISFIKY